MPDTHIVAPSTIVPFASEALNRHRALVRRVAHDLNNALVLPLTLGSLLAEELPDGPSQSDAEAIVAAALRARELVELLQSLSRAA